MPHFKPIWKIAPLLALLLITCQEKEIEPTAGTALGTSAELQLLGQSEATDAQNNKYIVGHDQVSGKNQNPYVIKQNAQGKRFWKYTYETTGVDGRGLLVVVDSQNRPWVVFTVDGGSNDTGFITKKWTTTDAFSGVYLKSYGNGGGPKASVLARLDPQTGRISKATFVAARLTSGKTNTLTITKLGFKNGNVAFEVASAAWPPGVGKSYQRFPDLTDNDRVNGAFKLYYEMRPDLSEITTARLLKN